MGGQKLVPWSREGVDYVVNNLRYGDCRANPSGLGKTCIMSFNDDDGQHRLVIQTPKMYCPFGAKEWEPKETGKAPKWDVVLNFKGGTSLMNSFSTLIQTIDEKNITQAFENQESFFGESGKSREIIADRYSPMFNSKDPKYDPRLATRLDVRQGVFSGQVYDSDENLQSLDYITAQSNIQALIEFNSIWVVDKRFGMTVKSIQLMVHKQSTISDLAITPMEVDENDFDDDNQQNEA